VDVIFQLHLDAREVLSDLEPTGDAVPFHPRSVDIPSFSIFLIPV